MEINQEQFDRYLMGAMAAEEKATFEAQLATNPAMQAELTLQQDLQDGIRAFGNAQLKTRLKALHAELQVAPNASTTTPPAKVRSMWTRLAAVAALVVLVAIGFAIVKLSGPPDPATLYATYYEPENFSNFRSGGDGGADDLRLAAQMYNKKAYGEAIPYLERFIDKHPKDDNAQLYLGICFLETDQLDRAHKTFQAIHQRSGSMYHDNANWYLALVYLKQGKLDECKQLLAPLSQDPSAGPLQTKAQSLLNELD